MDSIPFLDIKSEWQEVRDKIFPKIKDVLDSGQYIGGPVVADFEIELGKFLSDEKNQSKDKVLKYVAGVSSGTDALIVSMMAQGVKPGDEIITTPYTFVATAGSILRLGAVPVFVDIDPNTWNIDPKKIQGKITNKTVGIIPVHLFGLTASMPEIMKISQEHGLWVIEDTAQALGSRLGEEMAGTFGEFGCVSFYPTKNLGACGDAGAVICKTEALAQKVKQLRNHGDGARYRYETLGGNFRLDTLQACILTEKLKYLEEKNQKRRAIAGRYTNAFEGLSAIRFQKADFEDSYHVYHQFVIQSDKKKEIIKKFTEKNIGYGEFYPIPLHLQKPLSHLGYKVGDFPIAEKLADTSLALPVYPNLSEEHQRVVIDVLGSCFQ